MTIKELQELALHSIKRTAPTNYTVDTIDAAFADGLKELAGNVNSLMKNKYDIFQIYVEAADEIVPNKVQSALGIFADIKVVRQGEKAIFKRKVGKNRARKFLTQVGLSGVYETFRLDTETFEVSAHAVGGGAQIDLERMMDGAETLFDVMEVITDGLVESVFNEVQKALRAAFNASSRPSANKYTANTFTASEMVKLMNVCRAYGKGVIIFAPPEFIASMGADAIVPVSTNYQGVFSPDDIEAIHRTGFINIFRGAPIVQIPQSFIDENNTDTWIDPQLAYIFPTGEEKVVDVVLEGPTLISDYQNRDGSIEIYAYKKLGVAIQTHYNWCIYQNTGITQTYANPYGF